jgi:hypothetical protein
MNNDSHLRHLIETIGINTCEVDSLWSQNGDQTQTVILCPVNVRIIFIDPSAPFVPHLHPKHRLVRCALIWRTHRPVDAVNLGYRGQPLSHPSLYWAVRRPQIVLTTSNRGHSSALVITIQSCLTAASATAAAAAAAAATVHIYICRSSCPRVTSS